jgi:hypothetical protein
LSVFDDYNNFRKAKRILMKFDIEELYLSVRSNFGQKRTMITGTLDEGLHVFLSAELTGWGIPARVNPSKGIPTWRIPSQPHNHVGEFRGEILPELDHQTQVLDTPKRSLTPDNSDVTDAVLTN